MSANGHGRSHSNGNGNARKAPAHPPRVLSTMFQHLVDERKEDAGAQGMLQLVAACNAGQPGSMASAYPAANGAVAQLPPTLPLHLPHFSSSPYAVSWHDHPPAPADTVYVSQAQINLLKTLIDGVEQKAHSVAERQRKQEQQQAELITQLQARVTAAENALDQQAADASLAHQQQDAGDLAARQRTDALEERVAALNNKLAAAQEQLHTSIQQASEKERTDREALQQQMQQQREADLEAQSLQRQLDRDEAKQEAAAQAQKAVEAQTQASRAELQQVQQALTNLIQQKDASIADLQRDADECKEAAKQQAAHITELEDELRQAKENVYVLEGSLQLQQESLAAPPSAPQPQLAAEPAAPAVPAEPLPYAAASADPQQSQLASSVLPPPHDASAPAEPMQMAAVEQVTQQHPEHIADAAVQPMSDVDAIAPPPHQSPHEAVDESAPTPSMLDPSRDDLLLAAKQSDSDREEQEAQAESPPTAATPELAQPSNESEEAQGAPLASTQPRSSRRQRSARVPAALGTQSSVYGLGTLQPQSKRADRRPKRRRSDAQPAADLPTHSGSQSGSAFLSARQRDSMQCDDDSPFGAVTPRHAFPKSVLSPPKHIIPQRSSGSDSQHVIDLTDASQPPAVGTHSPAQPSEPKQSHTLTEQALAEAQEVKAAERADSQVPDVQTQHRVNAAEDAASGEGESVCKRRKLSADPHTDSRNQSADASAEAPTSAPAHSGAQHTAGGGHSATDVAAAAMTPAAGKPAQPRAASHKDSAAGIQPASVRGRGEDGKPSKVRLPTPAASQPVQSKQASKSATATKAVEQKQQEPHAAASSCIAAHGADAAASFKSASGVKLSAAADSQPVSASSASKSAALSAAPAHDEFDFDTYAQENPVSTPPSPPPTTAARVAPRRGQKRSRAAAQPSKASQREPSELQRTQSGGDRGAGVQQKASKQKPTVAPANAAAASKPPTRTLFGSATGSPPQAVDEEADQQILMQAMQAAAELPVLPPSPRTPSPPPQPARGRARGHSKQTRGARDSSADSPVRNVAQRRVTAPQPAPQPAIAAKTAKPAATPASKQAQLSQAVKATQATGSEGDPFEFVGGYEEIRDTAPKKSVKHPPAE